VLVIGRLPLAGINLVRCAPQPAFLLFLSFRRRKDMGHYPQTLWGRPSLDYRFPLFGFLDADHGPEEPMCSY